MDQHPLRQAAGQPALRGAGPGAAPRPDWVPGEMYIGGLGVAVGYLHDEEKTRTSFVRHPRTGERLYRSGDLGRCLPDGNIEFLGREDFQVKIHGYRIELGEIEAALAGHPDITVAVVVAVGERRGEKRLVAYVVPAAAGGDHATLVEALRAYVAEKLPTYMVPTLIVVLDTLPLTPNGKVDRKALPAPEVKGPGRTAAPMAPAAPETPVEAALAAIWADVLGRDRVGVDADCLELGAAWRRAWPGPGALVRSRRGRPAEWVSPAGPRGPRPPP